MKHKRSILAFGGVILVAVVLLLMRGPDSKPVGKSSLTPSIPVAVVPVQKQKLMSNIAVAGTINPNNDVIVVSQTQGAVLRVRFNVGATVGAGAVLVEVEDEIPRSNLATAEISYLKAKRDFDRSETLFQENSISPAQLDAARLAMKAAESQQEIARQQLQHTKITTPITGTVNARFVNVGTMVQPGTPIANIVDITTLKVQANVSEREAFELKPGDRVEVLTDVYPGHLFAARLENIASKADEAHTYPIEISMSNDAKRPLKAGMFCRISFASIGGTEALAVPRAALVGSVKNASVFVVRNGIAALRPIVVGKQTNEYFEILKGLSEADTIVTSGQNNLTDSTRVVSTLSH
ncbi:MAG: efflux RND transporter periplasmic adaptor subunit [Bacteroidota bacterium]